MKQVVKISKRFNKNGSTMLLINVDDKLLSITVSAKHDYVLIHHDTTFTDFTFSSLYNDVKVSELHEDGSVYSIGFNASKEE